MSFAHPSTPPAHELLADQQNARLDQRFEQLKSEITQWISYMNTRQNEVLDRRLAEVRQEMREGNAALLAALADLTTSVEALAKLTR